MLMFFEGGYGIVCFSWWKMKEDCRSLYPEWVLLGPNVSRDTCASYCEGDPLIPSTTLFSVQCCSLWVFSTCVSFLRYSINSGCVWLSYFCREAQLFLQLVECATTHALIISVLCESVCVVCKALGTTELLVFKTKHSFIYVVKN